MAYVQIDGTTLWELDREFACTCGMGWEAYTGDADIPQHFWCNAESNVQCYRDVSLSMDVSGSFELVIGSDIDQTSEDESWGFSSFSVTFNDGGSSGTYSTHTHINKQTHVQCIYTSAYYIMYPEWIQM